MFHNTLLAIPTNPNHSWHYSTQHIDLNSPSHLAFPQAAWTTPINPGPNTNQLPSIANQGTWASVPTLVLRASNNTWCPWASVPTLVFWATTNTQWASGHPPHP